MIYHLKTWALRWNFCLHKAPIARFFVFDSTLSPLFFFLPAGAVPAFRPPVPRNLCMGADWAMHAAPGPGSLCSVQPGSRCRYGLPYGGNPHLWLQITSHVFMWRSKPSHKTNVGFKQVANKGRSHSYLPFIKVGLDVYYLYIVFYIIIYMFIFIYLLSQAQILTECKLLPLVTDETIWTEDTNIHQVKRTPSFVICLGFLCVSDCFSVSGGGATQMGFK